MILSVLSVSKELEHRTSYGQHRPDLSDMMEKKLHGDYAKVFRFV